MEKRWLDVAIYKKTRLLLDGTMYAIRKAGHKKAT